MPQLRELLTAAGMDNVRTYVQSGNVVVDSARNPEKLAAQCRQQIADAFGLEIDVVARTRDELAEVVAHDPLKDVVTNPKRYQVSFLAAEPDPAKIEHLQGLAVEPERLIAIGREIYAWHPEGVARSKLWAGLAAKGGLGTTATARNWTTVTTLLEMADG
jgi:uncharacterized protein (DUF1697 family)